MHSFNERIGGEELDFPRRRHVHPAVIGDAFEEMLVYRRIVNANCGDGVDTAAEFKLADRGNFGSLLLWGHAFFFFNVQKEEAKVKRQELLQERFEGLSEELFVSAADDRLNDDAQGMQVVNLRQD